MRVTRDSALSAKHHLESDVAVVLTVVLIVQSHFEASSSRAGFAAFPDLDWALPRCCSSVQHCGDCSTENE